METESPDSESEREALMGKEPRKREKREQRKEKTEKKERSKGIKRKGRTPSEPLIASLLLVVRPGAPSSVLAPSSDARSP